MREDDDVYRSVALNRILSTVNHPRRARRVRENFDELGNERILAAVIEIADDPHSRKLLHRLERRSAGTAQLLKDRPVCS